MLENKIQSAIKPILTIYYKMELELIEKIAKHFNLNEEFINSDYWYFGKLKELGGLNNETLKLLEAYTGKTKKELLKAMQDIGVNSIPVDQLNIATQKNALLNPEKIWISDTLLIKLKILNRHLETIKIIGGVILILMGLIFLSGQFNRLAALFY